MQTEMFEVDPLSDNRKLYVRAAEALAAGALVGIPTETVYGLGADALNPEAVARVFEAKGRPSFDPLIIHVHHGKEVDKYTAIPEELKELVHTLASKFWPGPLTMVLPKADIIPDIVTSGLPTVAECGGFLYLGQTLEGADGKTYPMAGVLPGQGVKIGHLVRFGYAALTSNADSMLFAAGETLPRLYAVIPPVLPRPPEPPALRAPPTGPWWPHSG